MPTTLKNPTRTVPRPNGADVLIRTEQGTALDEAQLGMLAEMVPTALGWLQKAQVALGQADWNAVPLLHETNTKVKTLAEFCAAFFQLAPTDRNGADFRRLAEVITSTRTGLSERLTIKVVRMPGTRYGSVTFRADPKDAATKRHYPDGPHRETPYAGQIRLSAGKMHSIVAGDDQSTNPPTEALMTRILVHEATHRFAGTADYAYGKNKGNALENPEPGMGPLNAAKLCSNADSVAWLAFHAGMAKSI